MVRITLEVSEELSEKLGKMGDRLPEFLSQSLEQIALPSSVYRYVLNFLASNPTPQQIRDFRPTPEMLERLRILISKSKTGDLTTHELGELDEYERIEHLIAMLKSCNLSWQKLQVANVPIINTEQVQKNQAAIALLDSWLSDEEDANEQKLTWNFLKTALDEDRLSNRPLFS